MIELPMTLQTWLAKKLEQFHQMGYQSVTHQDLEDYYVQFLWKKQHPKTYIEQVRVISELTPNQFFDFKSMQILANPVRSLDELELEKLF